MTIQVRGCNYMSLIFIEDVIILSGHTSILLFCSYFTKKEIVNLYASFQLAKLILAPQAFLRTSIAIFIWQMGVVSQ